MQTDFEEPLCQGELDRIDLHASAIEQRFQVEAPPNIIIRLTDTFPVSNCPLGLTGCYLSPDIATMSRSLDHEIVHAITDQLAIPGVFWREGIAEVFGNKPIIPGRARVVDNIENAASSRDVDYETAGHFTRWLLGARPG